MATRSVLWAKIGPVVRNWLNGQLDMTKCNKYFSIMGRAVNLHAFKAEFWLPDSCVITTVCGPDEVVSVGHHLATTQVIIVGGKNGHCCLSNLHLLHMLALPALQAV